MASDPAAAPPKAAAPEPRPPLGAWPRLYAVVLGLLALEIVVLRLLPSLVSHGAR